MSYTPESHLRPCPFCGSEQVHPVMLGIGRGNDDYVECYDCAARGPTSWIEDACELWNTRVALGKATT